MSKKRNNIEESQNMLQMSMRKWFKRIHCYVSKKEMNLKEV